MTRLIRAVVAATVFTAAAWAETVVGFTGPGGVLSWGGGSSALVGSSIGINSTQGFGTGANGGWLGHSVSGGVLNFTTGSLNSIQGSSLIFNPGGSFSIVGGVPDAGIANGTTLLSGTFTGLAVFDAMFGRFSVSSGNGTTTMDSGLVSFYDLTPGFDFEFTATVLGGLPKNWASGFSTYVSYASVDNSPIPEPASIVLLSLVLLGCSAAARRRFRHQTAAATLEPSRS